MTAERIRVPVRRAGQGAGADSDWVAIEEPLEIRLGFGPADARESATVSITMRTPGDDVRLAAGFLLTEGVIGSGAALAAVVPGGADGREPNVVTADLQPGLPVDLERLRRHVLTGSGCGVCGKTSIDAVRSLATFSIDGSSPQIPGDVLAGLPAMLREYQPGFRETGGLHAAALFDNRGTLLDVREDVGRHNAVDKLIGGAVLEGRLPLAGLGLLVSGRASFEILQKARMAGCPAVVAVGAPSSLAIEFAWEAGMTLVGFLRDGRFNVYSGPDRITDWT